jgi:hypothetical protein
LRVGENGRDSGRCDLQARISRDKPAGLLRPSFGGGDHVQALIGEGDQILRLVDRPLGGAGSGRQRAPVDEHRLLLLLSLTSRLVGRPDHLPLGRLVRDDLVQARPAGATDDAILGEAEALAEGAVHALFEGRLLLQHLPVDVELQELGPHAVGPRPLGELTHASLGRPPRILLAGAKGNPHRLLHLRHLLQLLPLKHGVGHLDRVGLRRFGLDLGFEPREPGQFRGLRGQGFVAELLLRLDVDPLQVVQVAALLLDVPDLGVDVPILLAVDLLEHGVRLSRATGEAAHHAIEGDGDPHQRLVAGALRAPPAIRIDLG